MTLLESIWLEIGEHLEKQKDQIHKQIVHYPPPIPACDVQFNHLLEQRARITQELSRLREASRNNPDTYDGLGVIREFIESSTFIDDEMERKLMSDLESA